MQLGMIGLGRMGANMARRLMRGGHQCVAFGRNPDALRALAAAGARVTTTRESFIATLSEPRTVWLMVPAGAVDALIEDLVPLLCAGDTIVDGGNSHYVDDIRRGETLAARGIHYVDVGTSGGVWGLERG